MRFTNFSLLALIALFSVSVNAQADDDVVPRPGDDRQVVQPPVGRPGDDNVVPRPGDDRVTPRPGDDNPSRTRNGTSTSTPTPTNSANTAFGSTATGALGVVGLVAALLV